MLANPLPSEVNGTSPDCVLCYCVQMETEMIDKLDVFISGGMGDAKYRQQLYIMYVCRVDLV